MIVFISHSSKDSKWAQDLSQRLRQEGLEVSNPSSDYDPGNNFFLEAARALDRADAMIVLISPAFVGSEWAGKELEYALFSQKFKDRLIPVILRPDAEMPWILRRLQPLEAHDPATVDEIIRRLKQPDAPHSRARADSR